MEEKSDKDPATVGLGLSIWDKRLPGNSVQWFKKALLRRWEKKIDRSGLHNLPDEEKGFLEIYLVLTLFIFCQFSFFPPPPPT